jgi:tetratricopeptide (TPR) repeat protein
VARDLETIVMKALEKEPGRRYQSALALAEEIERYLRDEPILARGPSATYQLGRLVRRHRTAVGLAAGTFLLVAAAAVFMTVERNRARAAEAQARREAARATAIKDFLTGILASGDPRRQGREARVLDVIEDASRRLGSSMQDQPDVQAALHDTLSESFYYLGQYDQAREQAEAAVRLHERVFSQDHLAALKSTDNLVAALIGQGRFQESEALARQVIERKRRVLGPAHRETLASMGQLSTSLLSLGQWVAAEGVAREVAETGARVLPAGDEVTLNGLNDLGVAVRKQGRLGEAEGLLRRLVELSLRTRSESDPKTLEFMTNLVGALNRSGKLAEAEVLGRRVLALKQRVLGPAHAETVISQSGLGVVLCRQGKPEGAQVYGDLLRIVGAPDFESRNPVELYQERLGECLVQLGRHAEAEPLLLSSYEALAAKLGADDARTREALAAVVGLYRAWGRPREAAPWETLQQQQPAPR